MAITQSQQRRRELARELGVWRHRECGLVYAHPSPVRRESKLFISAKGGPLPVSELQLFKGTPYGRATSCRPSEETIVWGTGQISPTLEAVKGGKGIYKALAHGLQKKEAPVSHTFRTQILLTFRKMTP